MADPTPTTPPTTIGQEIDLYEHKVTSADDATRAAAAADRAMAGALSDRDGEKLTLTGALAQTGPITKALADGTFATYSTVTSTAGPQLSEVISNGVDTPLPAAPAPPPGPSPTPAPGTDGGTTPPPDQPPPDGTSPDQPPPTVIGGV